MPGGLTLSSNGRISGTPAVEGTFKITLKATNNAGSDTKELTLSIKKPGSNLFEITDIGVSGEYITQKTVSVSIDVPSVISSPAPKLIVASYANDGKLLKMETAEVSTAAVISGKLCVSMDLSGAARIKALIWNSLSSNAPLSNFLEKPCN